MGVGGTDYMNYCRLFWSTTGLGELFSKEGGGSSLKLGTLRSSREG